MTHPKIWIDKNGWIKSRDQLPPAEEKVLAFRNGIIGIGEFWTTITDRQIWKFNGTSGPKDMFKFSHWQHLPDEPEAE
jgi:hypothetical protein